MTVDQGLAIGGIVLTVVFGIWAGLKIIKSVRKKRISQEQKIGAGGQGIQSGRDTRIEK
jgi:hypothetical protein